MSRQAKRFQRLLLWCSYSLISLSLHAKGRNCKCSARQERCCVFANLKLWLPCASSSCLRVFNMRNRSRMMNEYYWPCTLTINLVSCIMQRDLTIQKLPFPHLWHNPIILETLRGWGTALWLYSLCNNTMLLFHWATWLFLTQNIFSLLYTWWQSSVWWDVVNVRILMSQIQK